MNEVQRLQYLEAMGIDSYVPRRVLPGARPSQPCEWPVLPVETPVTPDRDASLGSTGSLDRQLMSRLQQDLGSTLRKTAPARPAVSAVPAAHAAAASSPVLQFRLAIFQPVTSLLVLVPEQHMESQHRQLLSNILLAVGVRSDALIPVATFVWPLPSPPGVRMDVSLAAARETLHALLEGFRLKNHARQVLVFAGELADQLFPEQSLPSMGMYCLPELEQMLQDGRYKKVTWQKIRALVP